MKVGEQKTPRPCPVCSEIMSRKPVPPSTQVHEVIDNGIMPRRLTRLADAERLNKERADKDPQRARDIETHKYDEI